MICCININWMSTTNMEMMSLYLTDLILIHNLVHPCVWVPVHIFQCKWNDNEVATYYERFYHRKGKKSMAVMASNYRPLITTGKSKLVNRIFHIDEMLVISFRWFFQFSISEFHSLVPHLRLSFSSFLWNNLFQYFQTYNL